MFFFFGFRLCSKAAMVRAVPKLYGLRVGLASTPVSPSPSPCPRCVCVCLTHFARPKVWDQVYGFDMSVIKEIALTEPLVDVVEGKVRPRRSGTRNLESFSTVALLSMVLALAYSSRQDLYQSSRSHHCSQPFASEEMRMLTEKNDTRVPLLCLRRVVLFSSAVLLSLTSVFVSLPTCTPCVDPPK